MRHFDAGQMPEQHAVAVQCALRLSGGAGGEDHQRGIVRRCGGRRKLIGRAGDRLMKAERAIARSVDREHQREVRQVAADLAKLAEPLRVGDDRLHAGVLQAIAQRIDTEEDRERHRDRAELVDRNVPGRGLRRLRQQHRDPVAARDPCAASVLASRFEVSRSQPNVTFSVVPSARTFRIASRPGSLSAHLSQTSTPML